MTTRRPPASRLGRALRPAAMLTAATFLLSACSFHPGTAAVVNGDKIHESTVDDLVTAACRLISAENQSDSGTSVAYVRWVILNQLISTKLSEAAVHQLGLRVLPSTVGRALKGSAPTLPTSLSSHDRELLREYFTDSSRSQVDQAVIGAHLKDSSVTTSGKVTGQDVQAAQPYMKKFAAAQDVSINPSYGVWRHGALQQADGSLSSPVSPAAKAWDRLRLANAQSVKGLPANQVCGN